jgi:hypothetical protein
MIVSAGQWAISPESVRDTLHCYRAETIRRGALSGAKAYKSRRNIG